VTFICEEKYNFSGFVIWTSCPSIDRILLYDSFATRQGYTDNQYLSRRTSLAMNQSSFSPTIDEYLRKRLMPVEGAIPQLAGIDMYGNSVPAGTVGGDLFEYINFQQRYNIDGRIARALKLAKLCLDPLPDGQPVRNMVDDHVCWLENRLNQEPSTPLEYRKAKSSEQLRIAEDLPELKTTAGVLLVDAQEHGLISAKIASTTWTGENGLLSSEGVTILAFLWRAHAQSGLKEGIRRMQCDQKPRIWHCELTFVSSLEAALGACHKPPETFPSASSTDSADGV